MLTRRDSYQLIKCKCRLMLMKSQKTLLNKKASLKDMGTKYIFYYYNQTIGNKSFHQIDFFFTIHISLLL